MEIKTRFNIGDTVCFQHRAAYKKDVVGKIIIMVGETTNIEYEMVGEENVTLAFTGATFSQKIKVNENKTFANKEELLSHMLDEAEALFSEEVSTYEEIKDKIANGKETETKSQCLLDRVKKWFYDLDWS